jgi:hypothetical protein
MWRDKSCMNVKLHERDKVTLLTSWNNVSPSSSKWGRQRVKSALGSLPPDSDAAAYARDIFGIRFPKINDGSQAAVAL